MRDYRLGFQSLGEELSDVVLPVEGRLPDWLEGVLLRAGPALFEVEGRSYRHWFDGLGMLYRFGIGGGRVLYSNRLVRSRGYCDAMREGRIVHGEFATPPDHGPLGRIKELMRRLAASNNANVNVQRTATGTYALTETPDRVRFDPETLETLGTEPYADGIPGQVTTAHPLWDPERREWVNYLIHFGRRCSYRILTQGEADTGRRELATVQTDAPAYMHSFGLTDRFVILFESPFRVSPLTLLLSGEPFIANYRWRQGLPMRFHLIDRRDGSVRTLEAPPAFSFHQINAFDRPGEVVIDLCVYRDAEVIGEMTLSRLCGPHAANPLAAGRLVRYRLPLNGKEAVCEPLWDGALELPRIREDRDARRDYTVAWGVGATMADSGFLDSLIRFDPRAGRPTARWHEPGTWPGEPVIVPAPDGTGAVLLSLVLDGATGRSFLLVLEAGTLDELARAWLPHPAPFGFHGQFYPAGA
ncbi:carotenoid oxygenase family protein [Rhodospirillum centenum]|uniref:Dioxygenase n=1 Tax=Rhodospirillum centenum (strain ATCC 51521 / SW) TaxID=414684 RepID=B6IXD5_RHOCS|nr:carotenoid oxygenase family protein [Rhodospirillum centenum]ACJ00959.1 retinal pigment epithelial membrane protein, putative [Rhodospirillum centenum SW]